MIGFAVADMDAPLGNPTKPDWWFFHDTVKWELDEVHDGYKIIFTDAKGQRDYWFIGSVPARIFFDDFTYMDFDDEDTYIDFLKKYISKGYYDEADNYDPLDDMDVL
jgi:hypothetical protein